MKNTVVGFFIGIGLLPLFYLISYGLMRVDIIDDGVFIVNHIFVGLWQWIYLVPIIFIAKRRINKNSLIGLFISGCFLTIVNILFVVYVFMNPDQFF